MKLSIVTPNYNHARFLPTMIESVLSQSWEDFEYIIIDDCSKDDSIEVIERYAATDARIRVYRNERNLGVVATLNRGLALASADYIFFPGADDKVLPEAFARTMAQFERHPEAGLCSGLLVRMNASGRELGVKLSPVVSREPAFLSPHEVNDALVKHGSWMSGNTTTYRRVALMEAGGFIPELRSFTDGFAQMAVALKHGACFIPQPVAAWRFMETGYFGTTSANEQAMIAVWNEARRLMETRFAGVFPEAYVRRLDREWRYLIGVRRWASAATRRPSSFARLQASAMRIVFFLLHRSIVEWVRLRIDIYALRLRTGQH